MIELTVRLVVSLAIVVGLLLLTARLGSRRFRSGSGAPVKVLHRQALSRTSSIAVVEVGSRTLVLGATEHQINVLTELHASDLLGAPDRDQAPTAVIDLGEARSSRAGHGRPEAADFAPQLAAALEAGPLLAPASAGADTVPTDGAGPHDAQPAASTPRRRPGAHAASGRSASATGSSTGPLAGSVLSAETWRQAMAVARGRAR